MVGGRLIAGLWHDLRGMIWPQVCEVCGRSLIDGEEIICLHCDAEMPRTGIHLQPDSHIHQRLAPDVCLERAASMFAYRRESPYAALILKNKYHGRPDIGRGLAGRFAREIEPAGFFDGVDVIIPVPLHTTRRLRRGYNQAESIARGLADVTSIPVGDNLTARRPHSTQTRRGTYDRHLNVSGLFDVTAPGELTGRHVLVVDDVFTTGATMLECCRTLAAACPGLRLSVLTLASAAPR